ncbi:MAG: alpha-amylase/4-alpha-glucanotransferase domain-containing protein [Treponema sp.]
MEPAVLPAFIPWFGCFAGYVDLSDEGCPVNTSKKNVHVCFCVQLSISYLQQIDKNDSAALYKAFFSGIQAEEKLPLTVFAAGSFLEWQKGKRQVYTMLLNELLARKQIELLGGGYYQPYFPLLPSSDVIGQIELMTAAIRTHFEKRPRGLFLTASAWDPWLITPFTRCGMEYCLLDYRLFPKKTPQSIPEYPFTPASVEDKGKTMTIFPYIPDDPDFLNRTPQEFYDAVAAAAGANHDRLYLLFLPIKTYVKGLEKNKNGSSWFSSFIQLCSQPHSSVHLTHTAELLKHRQPHPPVYIAPDAVLCDQQTGYSIKNTLAVQPTAFQMYAKMMYVNMLANSMKGDKARKKYALQEFWKAQDAELLALEPCLSAYKHELHRIAYRKLLVAEKQTRLPGIFTDGLTRCDIDLDGFREVLSQRAGINMYVHHCGGKIFECDVFSAYKNYSDILLSQSGMFIDYLLSEAALQQLQTGHTEALTAVFSENTYQEAELNTIRSELKLAAAGFFDSIEQPVSLRKQYTFFAEGTQVQYILKNDSPFNLSAYFTVEIDIAAVESEAGNPVLSLYDGEENQKKELSLTTGMFHKVSWVQLEDTDGKVQFTMEANEVPGLVIIPVYGEESPVSTGAAVHTGTADSAQGTRRVHGVRLFFYWKTDLNPNYETEKLLFLKIKNKKNQK